MNEKKWASSFDVAEETILYGESIGKGSFGEVWSAVWCGSQVAAKTIHEKYFKKEYDQEIRDFYIGKLRNEWKVLQKLVHPNIVRMYTVLFPPRESPVIVMELMHCDLLHYIENSTSTPKVSPSKGLSIALGIAEGLEYLHGLTPDPVVHRDIATKNILLTVDGQPKIADLGIAKVFAAGKDDFATARPGTPLYAAPETYKKISRDDTAKYGPKVDIFSFGVVVLVINIGHEPVYLPINRPKGPKLSEVKKREKDIQQIQNPGIQQLVTDCLQEKGSNRPSTSMIVTYLQRIKDERQGQKVQRNQAVTFEKVSAQPSFDYSFKVLFLGNRSVGKSCLFKLLKNPGYRIEEQNMPLTMSIFPVIQWFQYNSSYVKLEIADTSGEERFFSLTSSYYRDVDGVFLTYDVSSDESFAKLPFWINKLRTYSTKYNIQMLLVGNKLDLRQTMEPQEMVQKEKALAFANMLECPYVETSAKCIDGVMAMYKEMVDILISAVSYEDVRIQMEEEKQEEARSTINLFTNSKRKIWNFISCSSCKNS